MTYNGWTNYQTWNVALWLDNDPGTESYVRELTAQAALDAYPNAALQDSLREFVDEMAPDLEASMFADLLGAALADVNWHEMAAHYLDDFEPDGVDA